MAKSYLAVHQPQPFGPNVIPYAYTVGANNYFFVAATGRARNCANLVACLIDHNTSLPYRGVPMRSGTHWVFGFPNLPANQATYHLIVAQTGAAQGNLVATVELTVPPHVAMQAHANNIPVQCPSPGATLCPMFVAYGSLVGAANTTGATMTVAGNTYNGAPITLNVPPGMWMYQFTNVPDGSDYLFTVTDAAGNQGAVANLTVDSGTCAPVVAPPPPPPP